MRREPSDEEIERDVAELRQLLRGLDLPAEPHPAYWQNFLVRVRQRVDERRIPRRRWAPSMAWASVTAAALVVVLAVSGVLPTGHRAIDEKTAVSGRPGPGTDHSLAATPSSDAALAADPLLFDRTASHSIVLSNDDVNMLKAIMADDDEAILQAMVDADM